jgi:hypothetical protein
MRQGWTAVLVALALGAALTSTARAQALNVEAQSAPFTLSGPVGFEADALPYATGGYYGSVWYGMQPWRLRAVVAEVNLPQAVTQPQFEHLRLDAKAIIVDRFIGRLAPALGGPWVGAGLESWDSRIEAKDSGKSATFHNTVFTAGGGHLFYFIGAWYLNPWFAFHDLIGGDTSVNVGARTYHPPQVTGEVSLKVGWHF